VGNFLGVVTIRASVEIKAQQGSPAGQDLRYVFNDRGPETARMLVIEIEPVIIVEQDSLDFDDARDVFHC